MEIRKRLNEPCSSKMALKSQDDHFETLQLVPYTPQDNIYDLDSEYSNSSIADIDQSVEIDMDPIRLNRMMDEQGNLVRFQKKILGVCEQNDGHTLTISNIMGNKSPSRISTYFMASLVLASEKKVQLQSAGKQGEPITMDELNIKLSRKT